MVSAAVSFDALGGALRGLAELAGGEDAIDADIYLAWENQPEDFDAMAAALHEVISAHPLPRQVRRLTTTVAGRGGAVMHHHFTFRPSTTGMTEERLIRGLHPYIAQRMQLERLRKFDLTRLPSSDEEVYLFQCVARENPSDERLVAFAQVRDLTALREHDGRLVALPTAEDTIAACLDSIRRAQSRRPSKNRFNTNRIVVYVWPPSDAHPRGDGDDRRARAARRPRAPGWRRSCSSRGSATAATGELTKVAVRISFDATGGAELTVGEPSVEPVEPLDDYRLKVLRASSRNTVYPYELTGLLGDFVEHDLDDDHALVPVDRPKGRNTAAIVAGVVTTPTRRHPQGVTRVVLLGDPTKALGALSEPECRRVIAALDLAERMRVPLEWYALSAGARISMESGTENMDWVAAALKRIVEFTQDGGEINIVVAGINVGAQPYWNAEATMLMHTKGILVMTPDSAMVLTGKQSLDFSGGVSAEDNFGIGGYDRVMGPNGQAQYWAPNLAAARDVLMAHYDHTLRRARRGARRGGRRTTDPVDRDISDFPHAVAGQRLHHRRRDLLRRGQPGPQEAVRHPDGDAGAVPTRTTRCWSAGRAWPTRRPRWCRTCTSAACRCACSASSRGRCRGAASRPPTARTPTPRARCSRGRRRRPRGRSTRPAATGRWWCWRTCPASTARRSRCASCSWSTAPRSAARS